jgi:GTP-binding protein
MFIDRATIEVKSGKGGDGMVHFRRLKYMPRGGPDGGDGGRGGDVVLQVEVRLNTLAKFRYKAKYHANDGARGLGSNMTGKSAPNLVIQVPPGTMVYDDATGEFLGDLTEAGQTLTVCKGGRGGRGNQHYATSRNQAPRMAEKGEPAVERVLRMELKLLADVGIVGVPNAGKSSFLAVVTNANPKIANYPFTTLEPNLGVAQLDEDTTLILADIPGLIEGAHMGVGLGFEFLRHVQRTRVLIHVLDGLSEDPIGDFNQINSEMALFDPGLKDKPQIVVLNKMDLPDVQEKLAGIKKALKKQGVSVVGISTATHLNLKEILWQAHETLKTTPIPEVVPELPVYRPEADPRAFTIEREEDGYRVRGEAIERAAAMTYWEYEGSLRRFQRLMETLGVDKALKQAGAVEGDTVYIGDAELEYQD